MVDTLLTILYVFVCCFLILVVLLQSGRSGGMGALSGGSTQTVFGGAGAGNFLSRVTSVCAALFMLLSALLAYRSTGKERDLEDVVKESVVSTGETEKSGNENGADPSTPDSTNGALGAPTEVAPPDDEGTGREGSGDGARDISESVVDQGSETNSP